MTRNRPAVSSRSFFRYCLPFLWMGVGGVVVYVWNPRAPQPERPQPLSVRSLTFKTNSQGEQFVDVKSLPKVPILRIVDGDTAQILWKDTPTFLRYYGVNTTERGHPCYDEGTARNRALSGGAVRLAFDERQKDNYGRLLAYVFTEDGISVDAQLVAEGLGKAWKRDGFLRERLTQLEDEARSLKKGCLWSKDAPPPKKKPTRKKKRRT